MRKLAILGFLLLSFGSARAADTLWTSCSEQRQTFGSYGALNNQYGVPPVAPDTQCTAITSVNPFTFGVHWRWALGAGGVKGYPNIYYGQQWTIASINKVLPVKATCAPPLNATFSATITGSSPAYNLIFDCWTSSATQITSGNLVHEIMISVNDSTSGFTYNNVSAPTPVTIDGVAYNFYYNTTSQAWKLALFVKTVKTGTGTVNITSFVNYLLAHGYMAQTEYFSEFSFGPEVVSGMGDAVLQLSGLP